MSFKCAMLKDTDERSKPDYKELDAALGKGAKVIYGGGKRKSKAVPYLDRLHLVDSAFQSFETDLFSSEIFWRYPELYLFEEGANETFFLLKFSDFVVTHFRIDDVLIDVVYHLSWSKDHLNSYSDTLNSAISSLDFFQKKKVGDAKLYKNNSAFIKSTEVMIDAVNQNTQRLIDKASIILKAGWK